MDTIQIRKYLIDEPSIYNNDLNTRKLLKMLVNTVTTL